MNTKLIEELICFYCLGDDPLLKRAYVNDLFLFG